MKLKRIASAIILLLSVSLRAQVLIYQEGFETDGEGTRYTSNTFSYCSGSPGNNPDYFLRTNTNPVLPSGCTAGFGSVLTNLQGTFFWASEDIRSSSPVVNGRPPGDITTQAFSVAGYNTLTVSLYLATSNNNGIRWETSDSLNIQASIDGGPFRTVGRFMGDAPAGGHLRIDSNLDGVINGSDPATIVDTARFTQYTFSIAGTGTSLRIKLDYDQLGGTEEMATDQIEVRGVSAPCVNPTVATASASPSTICSGNSTTLSVTSGTLNSATAWHWYSGSCGGTAVGTGTSISVSPASTTTYFVRGEGGCVSPGACGSVTVTVNTAPSAPGSISGASPICAGSTNTYSVTAVGGATSYTWTYPAGWSGTSTTNSISATASATSGNVSVTASNSCGTSAAATLAVTVNTIPATPGSISGNISICSGSTNTYSVTTVAGATSYTWTYPSGWSGSSTTNSINTTASATSGNVTVTAGNTCGSSAASSQLITVNTAPSTPGTITGATNICPNTTNTYSVTAVAGATSYTWILPGGWTGTSSTNTISVTANSTGGTLSVLATNACGASGASSLPITMIGAPVITLQPQNAFVCAGGNTGFTVAATGTGLTYQWRDNGSPVSNGPVFSGVTTPTLTLTGTPAGLDLHQYACVVTNSCGSSVTSNSATLSVGTTTPPAVTISGSTTICSGNAAGYTALPSNAGLNPVYQWFVNGNPVGTNSLNYSTTTLTNGSQVYCMITSGNACASPASSTSNTITVTVNSAPATPGTISGTTSICAGSTNTYSITTVAGATSYNWTLPSGWTGTSSTNSINATANAASGTVSVTATNSCGTSSASAVAVTVNTTPATPGAISGNATICSTTTGTYSVTAVSGATSYNWTLPSGWTGTSSTNTINATASATSGNISVTATNSCGTSSASTIAVTPGTSPSITTQPTSVTLCPPNTAFFSVAAAGTNLTYQWQINTGSGFTNLTNTATYNDVTTADMFVLGTSFAMNGHQFRCIISGGCGTPVTSTAVTLNVNQPLSVNSQPAASTICEGSNTTFVTAGTGVSSYAWQLSTDGGSTWNNLTNAAPYGGVSTPTLTVTAATLSLNGYLYRCHVSGTCSPLGQNTSSALLTINANPVVSISGATTICAGNTTTLTASGAVTYAWTSGPSTAAYTVAPITSTGYTVTGTDGAGCASSQSVTVTVNQPAAPVTLITAAFTTCQAVGSSIALQASPSSPLDTYAWSFGSTSGTLSGSTTVNESLTINNTSVSGLITVVATSPAGCSSAPYSQFINAGPFAPPAPASFTAAPSQMCAGTSNVAFAVSPSPGATSYVWTYSGNGATINGNGNAVTVDFAPNATSGSLCAYAVAATCTSAAICSPVIIDSLPAIVVTGDSALCVGENTLLTAAGADSYSWSSGGTSAGELLNPTVTTTYSVTGTTAAGCSSTQSVTVSVNNLPTVSILATNGTMICNGSSANLIGSGAQNYVWSTGDTTSSLSLIISGPVTVTVSGTDVNGCVNQDTLALSVAPVYAVSDSAAICSGDSIYLAGTYQTAAGVYIDTLFSIAGCDSIISTTLTVNTVNTGVTLNGGTLTSDENNAVYQWIDCNNLNQAIAGETNQSFTPSGNGNFAVVVTANNCTDTSACYTITGMQYNNVSAISVYPNPANEEVNITSASAVFQVQLFDAYGNILLSDVCTTGKLTLSTSGLSNGAYMLKISDTQQETHLPLIIVH